MAQTDPLFKVDGSIQLSPPGPAVPQPGVIHFDPVSGTFLGYNGSSWIPLSASAHINENVCPDPGADSEAPRMRCITSVTLALDNNGANTVHINEINLASTDNCGPITLSFSDIQLIETVELTCANVGNQIQRMWGKDAAGNLNYCDVFLAIQSNVGACP